MRRFRGKSMRSQLKKKTVDDLSNECLSKIFSYLGPVDRVRIERVCEKWRCVSRASWREVKRLVLSSSRNASVSFSYTWPNTTVNVGTCNFGIIRSIVSRCGSFVTSLYLGDRNGVVSYYLLGIIAEYCHNISRLELDVIDLHYKEIAPLLMCNNKLKEFSVCIGGAYLECLNILSPEVLETLSFSSSQIKNYKYCLYNVLANATSLRYFCCDFVDKQLLQLIAKIPTLKHLRFENIELKDFKEEFVLCIKELRNLRTIHLNDCSLDDDCMISLAENSHQLRSLEISDSDAEITERGFTALRCFRNLTTFEANWVNTVNAACLQHIPSTVTELHLCGCDNVTDDAIIPQIYRLTDLEELYLGTSITERTLEEAVTAAKARTNGKRLVIHTEADIDESKFNGKSTLLKVVPWCY